MKPRRWFRFSLRTLFVLLTACACAAAWLVVQVKWVRDRREFMKQPCIGWTNATCPAPWSIRTLGERGYEEIIIIDDPPDVEQIMVKGEALFPEALIHEYLGSRRYKSIAEFEGEIHEIRTGRRDPALSEDDREQMVKTLEQDLSRWKRALATDPTARGPRTFKP